ncbi:MAG TPA: NAD(P)-dependent alcohol dehydrogenase [Actinomycetes bacterium]
MKSVRLHHYQQHPLVEDTPEPTISDPLDVIVKIGGAGLCRTDLHIIEGQWASRSNVTLPYTLGHENAGWVQDVGSAVANLAPGDTVILHPLVTCGLCRACRAGDDMHCTAGRFPGIDSDGGMAQLLKTSARACVKLDPALQPADVAALADAGLTAYHAVKKAAPQLYPGTTAVVIGAGGLGHIAIQTLAALTPATIVVVDPSQPALELAKQLGAHHTIQSGDRHVQQVQELTDGNGAEVVVDFVGERGAQADAWQMTRRAGAHFVVGYGSSVQVETIDLISTERSIVGNLVGSYNDLAELMTLTAQGKVTLHTRTYPLEEVNQAMDDLDHGRLQGRGILVP